MHLKLQANGTMLYGFVSQTTSFTDPAISYNIGQDSVQFFSGKSGFGTRLAPNPYYTYFDSVNVISNDMGSNDLIVNDSFEPGVLNNNWVNTKQISYPVSWSESSDYVYSGSNSLKSPVGDWNFGSSNLYNQSFSNGSIDSWVYMSNTNDLVSGLIIRSDNPSCRFYNSYDSDICNGYIFRFEHHRLGFDNPEVVLYRIDNGSFTVLSAYTVGKWWVNSWMHLKLQANGTMLYGFVSQTSSFTSPVVSYNISQDSIQYTSGKSGFGTRLAPDPYYAYFDNVSIQYIATNSSVITFNDSFEGSTLSSKWISTPVIENQSEIWSINSNFSYDSSGSLQSPVGYWMNGNYFLYNQSFSNGSIDKWIYMANTNDLVSGLTIRSDNTNCGYYNSWDADICNGYIFRFEHHRLGFDNPEVVLYRIDNGNFTVLSAYTVGYWWVNSWMHLKLQANGTMLYGFVTQTASFTGPVISYNISQDSIQFYSGKSGFGTRLAPDPYYAYFDLTNLQSYDSNSPTINVSESYSLPNLSQNWIHSNIIQISSHWSLNSNYVFNGSYSLQSPEGNGSYGSYVLYSQDFSNNSVETWVYSSGTNDLMSGLAIRSDTTSCSNIGINYQDICNGYIFRFEHNRLGVDNPELVLNRIVNGSVTTLAAYSLGYWWSNTWMHLKLVANGAMLYGFVSQTDSFTSPAVSYDISHDSNQFYTGKSGFGTRLGADPYYAYFDSFTISPISFQSTISQVSSSTSSQPATSSLNKLTTSPGFSLLSSLMILSIFACYVMVRRKKN